MCEYLSQDYDIGDEVSSTYEGRHVTVASADVSYPATWDSGDILIIGDNLAGVALNDDSGDYVTIDTEGIWCLGVSESVTLGDQLYLNPADPDDLGDTIQANYIPFGIALTDATYSSVLVACVVKVHVHPAVQGGSLS